MRSPTLRAWDHRDTLTVLDPRGGSLRFDGDSAALARATLSILQTPNDREGLLAALEARSGGPIEHTHTVDELVAMLARAGAIVRPPTISAPHASGLRVVLGITGAVATAHTPALVLSLQAKGHAVKVAATRKAQAFVSFRALEAITHAPVACGLWGDDRARPASHIALATEAHAVLIAPASATTLHRLATGSFADVVSALALTTRAPVVVAPSMNHAMLDAPAVQRNLAQLADDGFYVVHPGVGLEVADAPGRRVALPGPMGTHAEVLTAFEAIVAERVPRATVQDWEALYRTTPPRALPWVSDAVEDDLRRTLAPLAPCALWDLGTGTGTVARWAAAQGFSVLATDLSARAIELASAQDTHGAVRWVVDDVCATRVQGRFGAIIDRGCLHALPEVQREAYVTTVAARLGDGGTLVLKAHTAAAAHASGTTGFTEDSLRALVAREFDVVEILRSTIVGARTTEAWLGVFRRRGSRR